MVQALLSFTSLSLDSPGSSPFGSVWKALSVANMATRLDRDCEFEVGVPAYIRSWWQQLAPYLLSIILMKLLVLLPLTLPHISVLLLGFGHGLLDYLSPPAQVIFVMAIFPLVMNVIQFCLVDQVIKAGNQVEKEEDEEEGGYTRVLTREADHEPAPRALSVSTARRRGSTVKSRSTSPAAPTTPNTPNSPLLSPADRKAGGLRSGYGSTTPSPGASMDDGTSGVFWASLIRPSISAEGITESSTIARSADSSSLGEEGMLRPRHGTRSGAPSPDSLRYDGATSVVIEPSDFSAVCSDSPLTAVSTASKLSDELRREARNSLSPKMRRSVPGAREEGEGWGLTDLEH